MTQMTEENLKAILGEVDAQTLLAIQATGASLRNVEEAKAIADQRSDIIGSGEQVLPGPVTQVLNILTGMSYGK
jgi:hypothetical protein